MSCFSGILIARCEATVCQLRVVLDLPGSANDFWRYLLVQFHIVFEVRHDRASQCLDFDRVFFRFREGHCIGFMIVFAIAETGDFGAGDAFDQYFTVPSGSFNNCRTLAIVPTV